MEEGEEDDDLGDVLWDDSESFGELLVVVCDSEQAWFVEEFGA